MALLVFTFLAEFCRFFTSFAMMMILVISTFFLVFLLPAFFLVIVFAGMLLVVMSLLGLLVLVPNLISLQTINRRSLVIAKTK